MLAGALPEALLPGVFVAGWTSFLPEHVWKTRKKKDKLRADLKTGSEVGTCQTAFTLE